MYRRRGMQAVGIGLLIFYGILSSVAHAASSLPSSTIAIVSQQFEIEESTLDVFEGGLDSEINRTVQIHSMKDLERELNGFHQIQ